MRIIGRESRFGVPTLSGGTAQDIARSAGQTAMSHEDPGPGGAGSVLLLDAGVVFEIFVEHPF